LPAAHSKKKGKSYLRHIVVGEDKGGKCCRAMIFVLALLSGNVRKNQAIGIRNNWANIGCPVKKVLLFIGVFCVVT
jgi:hypothetical protein